MFMFICMFVCKYKQYFIIDIGNTVARSSI